MPTKPLVSILIPAFNSESLISQTIECALSQTWPRVEVIVVDDGSTDGTYAIGRKYASERVAVVTQLNQGAAAARNTALSLSRGDYIQWLDADDIIAPDKIATQLEALGDPPNPRVLLSSGWAYFLFRTRKARFVPSPLWADLGALEWLLRKMETDNYMQTSVWLVSRELTQAAGPWDTRLLTDDDGEYFCRVLLASEGTKFVAGAKTYYRMTGGGSLSRIGDSDRKLDALFISCKLHVDYVLSLDRSERSRAACVKYLQKYMSIFYGRRPDIVQEMQQTANALGGSLRPPTLPWKYAWMHRLFGWNRATLTRRRYNALKWSLARQWDRALFHMETRGSNGKSQ